MTEIYLHFIFAHDGLYGNAPVGGTTTRRLASQMSAAAPRVWRFEYEFSSTSASHVMTVIFFIPDASESLP